jgi:hypothetical protein
MSDREEFEAEQVSRDPCEEAEASGPEVLHGPWTHTNSGQHRIVRMGKHIIRQNFVGSGWYDAEVGPCPAELARLSAENRELRENAADIAKEQEDLYGLRESEADARGWAHDTERENDRLRALVARMRMWIYHSGSESSEREFLSSQRERDAIEADESGHAAAEWLDREREKAAEPWKDAAARARVAMAFFFWPTCRGCNLPFAECSTALDWFSAREAKAREEGRGQGLKAACAALREVVTAAGCLCQDFLDLGTFGGTLAELHLRSSSDEDRPRIERHDFRCPHSLAASMEALAEKGGTLPPSKAHEEGRREGLREAAQEARSKASTLTIAPSVGALERLAVRLEEMADGKGGE